MRGIDQLVGQAERLRIQVLECARQATTSASEARLNQWHDDLASLVRLATQMRSALEYITMMLAVPVDSNPEDLVKAVERCVERSLDR